MSAKRYANLAFGYAIAAMVFGVFYREFTKFSGFTGSTSLSVMHTHYFILGMVFFLLLLLIEKAFPFAQRRGTKIAMVLYNIGLNITGLGFLVRGIIQVQGISLNGGVDAALSGGSGIGHILLGAGIILFLLQIRKQVAQADAK